jgi:aminopeptidase N
MREAAEEVFEHHRKGPRPVIDTAETDLFALLNPNNYEKGAWVLHMLRRDVGDEIFFGGVRDYYAAFAGGNAWTADFARVMEEASGRDLGWFFEQWLDRPGHPVLKVTHEAAGPGRARVLVRQAQAGPAFRFPLELELAWEGGSRRERIEVREAETVVVFETPAPLRSVTPDPGGWLLHE